MTQCRSEARTQIKPQIGPRWPQPQTLIVSHQLCRTLRRKPSFTLRTDSLSCNLREKQLSTLIGLSAVVQLKREAKLPNLIGLSAVVQLKREAKLPTLIGLSAFLQLKSDTKLSTLIGLSAVVQLKKGSKVINLNWVINHTCNLPQNIHVVACLFVAIDNLSRVSRKKKKLLELAFESIRQCACPGPYRNPCLVLWLNAQARLNLAVHIFYNGSFPMTLIICYQVSVNPLKTE